ncbi:major capsid protein [Kingella negevensis]|uniref:major capsid protein n=1 Tax=Kingella negevensis TaxID=1522312 RepID=UPI002542CDFA|nr:major capsid protein [Kingella negevensis]WII92505.1 major capsid protein [Kingella negevensis]
MKFMNRVNAVKTVAGAGLMALAINAQAALPDNVKTALEGAKTDGMEAGWLVVGIIAALFVIAIVKRLLR